MAKRLASLTAAVTAAMVIGALLLAGGAGAAGSLPTMKVALTGTHGVAISGSTVSGAVDVVSTFKGKVPHGSHVGPALGLVRLHEGVSLPQAFAAVQRSHGDINALTPYGTLIVSATAPGTLQTVLTPGNYVALNLTGNGQPGAMPFTVTPSSSPAALPRARTTQTAIDFAFRGPTVLHDGTIVRAVNGGYLVHMIDLIGVRNAATGRRIVALLRAGKDHQAERLASRRFVNLLGPASPGALQQQALHTKPGYYVEACFMTTQDGREHTRLGMERLVRVVK
ncbi:MAG TPA: hypothetical protein VFW09_04765 [Solirubrobacteraceae bacterium]|jgi:hypothetical protein|nr:hypothetical protein [Solirubrobacteraceae bacterium]